MAITNRIQEGNLLLAGEVNERLPAIADGLVAHYPFDGVTQGIANNNILDYSTWIIGSTGSQTGFTQNGETECNSIINDVDPFGKYTAVWRSLNNDATSDADGGWATGYYSIDNTKTYRLSVWIQRRVLGNGNYYFGTGSSGAYVLNRSNGASNNNPYFSSTSGSIILGDWFLLVGHVWPVGSGTGAIHIDTGVYDRYGNKLATGSDYVFDAGTTGLIHRTYLYYSTDPTTEQLWVYPRMELCDGTEPTIQDLLNGEGNVLNGEVSTNNTLTFDGIAVEEATTNLLTSPMTFDDPSWVYYNSLVSDIKYLAPDGTLTANKVANPSKDRMLYVSSIGSVGQTKSIYARTVQGQGTIHVCGYNAYAKYLVNLTEKWQRFSFPVESETGGSNFYAVDFRDPSTLSEVLLWHPQLEAKLFPTSFVNGNRSDGIFTLNKNIKYGLTTWTVSAKVKFDQDLNNNAIFDFRWSGDIPILFRVTSSNNLSIWYLDGTDTNTGYNPTAPVTNITEWNIYTITYNGSDIKAYFNGELKLTKTTSLGNIDTQSAYLLWDKGGSPQVANGTIKDFSIYNRALTDVEILSLTNTSSQITNSGNLITDKIVESPMFPNVIHVPLGSESDSLPIPYTKTETNTVYENGSVWLGKSTINEFTYPTFDTSTSSGGWSHWGASGAIGTYGQNTDKEFIFDKNENYSHWVDNDISATGNYLLYQSPATDDTDRSARVIICMSDKSEVTQSKVFPAWNAQVTADDYLSSGNWSSIERIGSTHFYLCKAEGLHQDGTNDLLGFYVRPGYKAYFSQTQLEQKAFSTPFVNGTRGSTVLKYELPTMISSETNWAVGVFAKLPKYKFKEFATGDDRVAILSVGDYYADNQSDISIARLWGGAYNSIGNVGAIGYNNKVSEYFGVSTLAQNEYQDWILYIIQYDASLNRCYIKFRTNTRLLSSYYTKLMTGLQPMARLGGYSWDESNGDGLYKDFFVLDRLLTDDEINTAYITNTKVFEDKMQIKNAIIEGVSL